MFMFICMGVCVIKSSNQRKRLWMREREMRVVITERGCVCVRQRVFIRERGCGWVGEREKERVVIRERLCTCVCVCMCGCMCRSTVEVQKKVGCAIVTLSCAVVALSANVY